MRIILLVMLFLIWEGWSPAAGAWCVVAASVGVPLFFSGYCLLILLTRFSGRRIAHGMTSGHPGRTIDRFKLLMSVSRILIPIWFAVGVFTLGWKQMVDQILGPIATWPVLTPGTIIGLLPGFFAWMGLWWSQYPVDRALREHNALYQLEADLPVFSPSSFRGYFVNKLRTQLLFSIVPLLLILSCRDGIALAISAASRTAAGQRWDLHLPLSDSAESVVSFGSVVLVLLISPELLRHVLHTQRLPESPLRASLTDLCTIVGVRCRDILLWRTQNNLGNAAVMGLIPRIRYVMLSDLLLESMPDNQIQAVFAHELGHVKHRHLLWFVVFFLTVTSCMLALLAHLENHLTLTDTGRQIFDVTSAIVSGSVLLIGFGYLSRWFERQADVFAARTLQRTLAAMPAAAVSCTAQAPASDIDGASIFVSALARVAVVNNIPINARNWTHGSIQSRMRFIKRLSRDPLVGTQFDRTGRRVLALLILLIVLSGSIVVYGQFSPSDKILQPAQPMPPMNPLP